MSSSQWSIFLPIGAICSENMKTLAEIASNAVTFWKWSFFCKCTWFSLVYMLCVFSYTKVMKSSDIFNVLIVWIFTRGCTHTWIPGVMDLTLLAQRFVRFSFNIWIPSVSFYATEVITSSQIMQGKSHFIFLFPQRLKVDNSLLFFLPLSYF